MAYTASKNPNGTYTVQFNGQNVATGTDAILSKYGLSSTQLIATPTGTTSTNAATMQPAASSVSPSIPTVSPAPPATPQATQTPAQTSQPTQTNTSTPSQGTQSTSSSAIPPSVNLSPGATGQNVQQLQNWLVQMGYMTPAQVSTGSGTYGPQTTAAVAQLQKDLGLNPTTGSGSFGPQTQAALAQKYNSLYQGVQNSQVPQNSAEASAALASATQTSSDPIFGSLVSSMQPILDSLNQVISNINNPALTGVSLQQEYNDLSSQYNLPGLNSQLMNMQNIMNGTTDDIRQEITAAGGTATESQVQAMSAARNNVIMKQYNSLATQYQAAQTNVQNLMQYASTDQQTALQKQQITASITESMQSIEAQMVQMGMTMQKNASDNLNKVVTNIGYNGLAQQAQGDPQVLSYYEQMLGLAQGSLSDPATLSQLDTLRQKQLQLGQQRVTIQMYNAGMGVGGTQTPIVANPGGGPSVTQPYNTADLSRPSWLPTTVPLSMSDAQMQQYMQAQKASSIDPGTNNVIAPGIGYYVQQSDGSYVLNSAIPSPVAQNSIDGQYNKMVSAMTQAQSQPVGGSPLNKGRLSRNANTALKAYLSSPVYQNVSNGAVYLSRINAALKNPGSISDLELADSIIKINNGGGQVTEAQLETYFQGQSFADKFAVVGDKMDAKGGVLSPQQRQDLADLAQETFGNYQQQYEQLYVQAGNNLLGQGIPINYLGNFPDWTSFLSTPTPDTSVTQ